MLELLLKTMALKGNINKNTTDILIYTQSDFEDDIKKIATSLGLSIKTEILNLTSPLSIVNPKYSLFESSRCRLSIFNYKDIDKYSKILYFDTDILINGDINTILNLHTEDDKLYAAECGNITEEFYGSFLFDYNTLENKKAFSNSVLLFNNSPVIKDLFNNVNNHINKDIYILKKAIPTCLEQPYVIYNSFTQNKYNNTLMTPYIVNYDLINNEHVLKEGVVIYHFAGVPGLYVYKYPKMVSFFDKIVPDSRDAS